MPLFDAAAKSYDQDFTNSPIGRLQRDLVWKYLKKTLPPDPIRILELNGGTGEDAVWLAKMGHQITLTDVSAEMIGVANEKIKTLNQDNITTQLLDLRLPDAVEFDEKFDMVFSNFAGLNCLDQHQLIHLFQSTDRWLKPNGQLVLVFLGKYCFWEWLYFSLKGKFASAKRRWSKGSLNAIVNGESVSTWYYSTREIKQLASSIFKSHAIKPIGLFLPPSYLNSFFEKRSWLLSFLNFSEHMVGRFSLFANFSDHFLIQLHKK